MHLSRVPRVRHKLKRVAYALLPDSVQESIDRWFYFARLRRGDLSEEPEFDLLPSLVGPGDVVIDIGANLGGYTVRLSQLVGRDGEVHAFEPVPRTMRLLAHNVRRLAPYQNVRLHQLAASDRSGTAVLRMPLEGSLANYYTATLARAPGHTRPLEVRTVSLDEREAWDTAGSSAPRRITFIKVDTEGAEWLVLSGALGLLRSERPAVLCEVSGSPQFGHAPQEVFDLMASVGLRAFRYRDGRLHERSGPDEWRLPNYLFCPDDVADRLSASVPRVPA